MSDSNTVVDNSASQVASQVASQTATQSTDRQTRLVDIPISSENVALNVLIGFLSVAQKRGTFLFDESAKINECIKVFMKPVPQETSD